MSKILVADDKVDFELLIKQRFRRQIREHKYEFVFAMDGKDALEKLKEHPDVDMVLSEINMPEMDGLTLLTKLNEINPFIKTVIVSAYGDMDNIRMAMNRGAFDFITKPINFEDLELTIIRTLKHVNQLKETMHAIKENKILRMYVDETALQFMQGKEFEKQSMSNETIDASVVFIGIWGFADIAENKPADIAVTLLNKYFDVIAKQILAQGGHVDKFISDDIMAIFRGEYHLDRAIEASLAVRAQIEKQRAEGNELDFSPKVSIGIDSGEVISGNIGSPDLKRLVYSVVGNVVDTAQRMQIEAVEGQILLNETLFQKIKDFFNCKKVGELPEKNKQKSLIMYEVLI